MLDLSKDKPPVPTGAVDSLASRWLKILPPHQGSVFSPIGLWPVLAFLVDFADDTTRPRLEDVLGELSPSHVTRLRAPPSHAGAATALVRWFVDTQGVDAATALWMPKYLRSKHRYSRFIQVAPSDTKPGELGMAIAHWANKVLYGAIPDLKLTLGADIDMYLASTVVVRTAWETQFTRDEETRRLRRTTRENGIVRASPEVTTVLVRGSAVESGKPGQSRRVQAPTELDPGAHDIYVVLGREGEAAGTVLSLGLEAIRGKGGTTAVNSKSAQTSKIAGNIGPGLTISIKDEPPCSRSATACVDLALPSFRVEADNTFDERAMEAFGLKGPDGGAWNSFPDLEPDLAAPTVRAGSQRAAAEFGADGFAAAALTVTAVDGKGTGSTTKLVPTVHIAVNVDREFGFIAVHKETGLLLLMGWVTEAEWTQIDPEIQRPHRFGLTHGREEGTLMRIPVPRNPTTITVYSGWAVDGIEINGMLCGQRVAERAHHWNLNPGEVILGIDVRHGFWIDAIQFVTNQRWSPWFGKEHGGGPGEARVPPGYRLSGVCGHVQGWCRGLQFEYERDPTAAGDAVAAVLPSDAGTAACAPALPRKPATGGSIPTKAVDTLARRWISTIDSTKGTVFSPVGLWPILGVLADAARPDVRAELEAALGLDGSEAYTPTELAIALVQYMSSTKGLAAAAGVWLRQEVGVRPDFVTAFPAGMVEFLSGNSEVDRAAIEVWANRALGGIMKADVSLNNDTLAYLASAVTLTTKWAQRFYESGGLLCREKKEDHTIRTSPDVTTVLVRGTTRVHDEDDGRWGPPRSSPVPGGPEAGAHDVYLVIGKEGASASEVLTLGLEAIRDSNARVQARTPFTPALYGLGAATDPTQNAFPGMAGSPLVVQGGDQQAVAEFTRLGFTAAAYTQVSLSGAAMPNPKLSTAVFLDVEITRPFAFLAVEPETQLLIFAGWVTEKEFTAFDPAAARAKPDTESSSSGPTKRLGKNLFKRVRR